MTSDLHTQLHDLAADAPAAPPVDAGALWRSGKRRHRRRAVAGAVAALAIVAAGVGGAGAILPEADRVAPPAATEQQGALPDRLHEPSRWTESNDDDPAGPFAVLLHPQSGLGWSGYPGYVGISALSGEYRAIELPDDAGDVGFSEGPVLSPTGRYVAFWTSDVEADEFGADVPVSGVAVYDTETGDVVREQLEAPKGFLAWDLVWIDGERLYVQAGEIDELTAESAASHAPGAGWVWEPADGAWDELAVPGMAKHGGVVGSDEAGHLLVKARGAGRAGYLLVDPERPTAARPVTMKVPGEGAAASQRRVSPAGRVAIAATTDGGQPFLAVTAADGSAEALLRVPAWDVYGWSDATHVVANVASTGAESSPKIVRVDVATGTTEPFIGYPEEGHINPPQLASALLDTAPVERPAPDAVLGPENLPFDPLLVALVAVGVLPLAAVVGVGFLRRRRARG